MFWISTASSNIPATKLINYFLQKRFELITVFVSIVA